MITSPKNAIQEIASGSDFYFRFKSIDVIRNGSLLTKITSANCEDSTSTFIKGGPAGGMMSQLDFDESGMSAIQRAGAFIGMECGFDLYLIGPWRWIMSSGPIHAIAYDVNAGGIEKFVITAGDTRNAVYVQIFTSDGYVI